MVPTIGDRSMDVGAFAVASAIEGNLHDLFFEVARCARLRIGEEASLSWVDGRPARWPSAIFSLHLDERKAEPQVRSIVARIRAGELPPNIRLGPLSSPPDLEPILRANGFSKRFENTNMAMELAELDERAIPRPGLTVSVVDDSATLREWVRILFTELWHFDEQDLPAICGVMESLFASSRFVPYIARLDGLPVATSALFCTTREAGIYHVATLTANRNQGIGKRVMLAAMLRARDLGYRLAILHASELGEPLYRGLGFRDYGKLVVYGLGEE